MVSGKVVKSSMAEVKKKRDKERKDQAFYIRMTKSEMAALELASYETENSKSDIVRKAVKSYLAMLRAPFN